jgi:protein SCO1/2
MRRAHRRRLLVALEVVVCAIALARSRPASGQLGQGTQGGDADGRGDVGVTEHLGEALPLDLPFVDHHGRSVHLRDYFAGERPVLLVFGYHTCPMLCSLVQHATAEALRGIGWRVGRQFEVVVISIDPEDTPEESARHRDTVVATYEQGRADDGVATGVEDRGWHYLTGKRDAIVSVTAAAGFRYSYDAAYRQYAHPAVIQLVTPQGKLARYLYGMEPDAQNLRLGLIEAAAGRSVSTIDRVLLFCMHYDPAAGKYVAVASRVMQVGGGACLLFVGVLLGALWRRERRMGSVSSTGT